MRLSFATMNDKLGRTPIRDEIHRVPPVLPLIYATHIDGPLTSQIQADFGSESPKTPFRHRSAKDPLLQGTTDPRKSQGASTSISKHHWARGCNTTHIRSVMAIYEIEHTIMADDRLETKNVVAVNPVGHKTTIGWTESGGALSINLYRSAQAISGRVPACSLRDNEGKGKRGYCT